MTNSASTANKVAEAHQRLRADSDIQFDLPLAPPPKPRAPATSWFDWVGSPSQAVLWIVAGILVALLVWLVVRTILARQGQGAAYNPRNSGLDQWRPEAKVARALLAEADEMAASGRYEEAARLLLHRSIEDIQKRKPRLLKPALTSREIGANAALPDAVRATFSTMAGAVERSLFGGRSLSRESWEEARAAYDNFALSGAWA
ncbi:hypothetical protein P1X14_10430 [Sphingomonas sp. AOB5]|uniref:hypothetical protein n=1 Tax=Sphingomonas sp. AOB5 TaxID=3034017 RepID=UPI0023F684E0|nr:hypothetical protein [Sphingomonas sp. AOB5]MDF7775663.1 hypothetical protein [Sphingomonas sp. AOB5]